MSVTIKFEKPSKQINLDEMSRSCSLQNGTHVPCVSVRVNLTYLGILPDKVSFQLKYVLDARKNKRSRRMFLLDKEGKSTKSMKIELTSGKSYEDLFWVYFLADPQDKLNSLDILLKYNSIDLDPPLEGIASDSISIQKDCGLDNLCIPDLSIYASL